MRFLFVGVQKRSDSIFGKALLQRKHRKHWNKNDHYRTFI